MTWREGQLRDRYLSQYTAQVTRVGSQFGNTSFAKLLTQNELSDSENSNRRMSTSQMGTELVSTEVANGLGGRSHPIQNVPYW